MDSGILVDPAAYTADGRYWWPGIPPGERMTWDIKRWLTHKENGEWQPGHEEIITDAQVTLRSPIGPAIWFSGEGLAGFAGFMGLHHTDEPGGKRVWFAFKKATAQTRWVPLDDARQRIPQLPDVFSLFEARYAITQLEKIWPGRSRVAVNYTEWQPNRSNNI